MVCHWMDGLTLCAGGSLDLASSFRRIYGVGLRLFRVLIFMVHGIKWRPINDCLDVLLFGATYGRTIRQQLACGYGPTYKKPTAHVWFPLWVVRSPKP